MEEQLSDVFRAATLNLSPRRTSIYHRTSIMLRLFKTMPEQLTHDEARSMLRILDKISSQMHTVYDLHELPYYKELSERCHDAIKDTPEM